MRKLATGALIGFLAALLIGAASQGGLLRAYLQSNLDGNGFSALNLDTISAKNFVDAPSGLPFSPSISGTNATLLSLSNALYAMVVGATNQLVSANLWDPLNSARNSTGGLGSAAFTLVGAYDASGTAQSATNKLATDIASVYDTTADVNAKTGLLATISFAQALTNSFETTAAAQTLVTGATNGLNSALVQQRTDSTNDLNTTLQARVLGATNGLNTALVQQRIDSTNDLNTTLQARVLGATNGLVAAGLWDATGASQSATNTARLAVNLAATFDAINAAQNATNTARLAINLGGSFDASGAALTATNQLAIANTNLWDPLNSAQNATNTARLAVNLAGSFDALNAALNATNTARLATQLAATFDALNAALNATNTSRLVVNLGSSFDASGVALTATNQLAIANTNLWDPLNSALNATNTTRLAANLAGSFDALNAALNATNTARLAVNLASSFDASGVALTATNQLAIANTNLWDPINSALNSTNTARLEVNLASSFDSINAALNATNTPRLAINLASTFDALNAALNSTNGTFAWTLANFVPKTGTNMTGALTNGTGFYGTTYETNTQIAAQSANYAIVLSDTFIPLNGARTATLPTAVGIPGRQFTVWCATSGTNAILTTSSQTINGATKWTNTAQFKFTSVMSDGANWRVVGQN